MWVFWKSVFWGLILVWYPRLQQQHQSVVLDGLACRLVSAPSIPTPSHPFETPGIQGLWRVSPSKGKPPLDRGAWCQGVGSCQAGSACPDGVQKHP